MRERSHWGWGWADKFPARDVREGLASQAPHLLGFSAGAVEDPVPEDAVVLRAPRVAPPPSLARRVRADAGDRIRHTLGRGWCDLHRGFHGDFSAAPDLVAHPANEQDVVDLLDWASHDGVAMVPFGGGTSVVGGVEAVGLAQPVVSLDLTGLTGVVEVERSSLSAHIRGGTLGPALEKELASHGLTLRHFPQSFEFSTLGGWIATRAGGHFATVYTHIDDLVQSTRMVTPRGVMESRRLPASGAGPSMDRLVLGSEGTLGVITSAWMRVRPRPTFRAGATVHFTRWEDAVEAVRALSQSGLFPSNCRLLDAREAALNHVTSDGTHVLVLAFESADHALGPWMARALELCADHAGTCPGGAAVKDVAARAETEGAESWRSAFVDAPYLQGTLLSLGVLADTFETACTWDRFQEMHAAIIHAVTDAQRRVCGAGTLSCRFTHVYPDGPAPYYTFISPVRGDGALEQWATLKRAASDAILAHGGTITHHHSVGRTHRDAYQREVPPLFLDVLRAAKKALDPAGVLNPGCLI